VFAITYRVGNSSPDDANAHLCWNGTFTNAN
jgi:hypothetical protein